MVLAYQFTQDNQVITQVLPPSADKRTIIVKNIFAGFSGCRLILTPATNEFLNGSYQTISLEDVGVQGILLPDGVDHYEFISYRNTTTGSSELEFVGVDGKTITGNKLTSNDGSVRYFPNLDGSIDLSVYNSNIAEGIFARLNRTVPINTNFRDSIPSFEIASSKTGMYIGFDRTKKAYTLQEGDMKDPNVTGGSRFKVYMYIDVLNKPIASEDGYIELKFINPDTKDYIIGNNGRPFAIRRDYKAGEIIGEELLTGIITAKGQMEIAPDIDVSFKNQVLELSGNSAICIQLIDQNNQTGIFELEFERNCGYTTHSNDYYYGDNFFDLNYAIRKTKGETEFNNTNEYMGDGWFIDNRTKGKVSIVNSVLTMQDNGTDLPVMSVGNILNKFDTFQLRNKVIDVEVKLQDKDNAFDYAMLEWIGQGEAKLLILERFENEQPIFNANWRMVSKKFISEDVVSGIHTDTNAFTVPQNADQVAIVLYPIVSQIPTTLKLVNMRANINPVFSKTIITNTAKLNEEMLVDDKYIYKSVVATPSGDSSYRYTVNNIPTKIPIGVFKGNGEIFNNNAWTDVGSYDPNKTQGDIEFKVDGKVKIEMTPRIFNETSTLNSVNFWLSKVGSDGLLTKIESTNYTSTIPANSSTPRRFTKIMELDVKKGESYRLLASSNVADGFYLESDTDGVPLLEIIYTFNEIQEVSQEVLNSIEIAKELEIVEDGKPVSDKKLVYDIKTKQLEVVDK